MSKRNQAIDHHNLGCDLLEQKRDAEALKEFEKAIEYDPSLPSPFVNAGNCLKRGRRCDESAYYYIKAIELEPSNVLAHCNYGAALFCMSRYKDALCEYEITLQLDARNYDATWGMSQSYAAIGMSLKGIKYAIIGLALNPFILSSYTQSCEILGLAVLNCLIKARKK